MFTAYTYKTDTNRRTVYGPDPNINSSLANAIALAKKDSVPKDVISQAIERGQGRSLTGTALETMKFEAIVAPSVAFIIDVETDNKLRALQDVNLLLRRHKARTTATEFLFSRRGRVVFGKHDTIGLDEMMDNAIELGAEDLENDDDDNVIVWTQPTQTMKLAQGLAKDLDLEILSSDIIWSPNDETRATVDSVADVKALTEFVHALAETPEVQAIYSNAVKGDRVPDEEWEALGSNLDA